MKTIKLKLEIDLTNPAIIAAFNTLLLTIGNSNYVPVETVIEQKPKKVVKETPTIIEEPEKIIETVKEVISDKTDEKVLTIKLEDVRALLGKKVGDHREVIKEKLTELDAKNVSVLKPEHYVTFMDFLNTL